MSNVQRLNEAMRSGLAEAVNKEVALPGALITVAYVECSTDLKQARVGFSVLPDRLAGSAGRALTDASGRLIPILKSRLKLRRMPRLIWEFDATEREAEKIEKIIAEANDDL